MSNRTTDQCGARFEWEGLRLHVCQLSTGHDGMHEAPWLGQGEKPRHEAILQWQNVEVPRPGYAMRLVSPYSSAMKGQA